MKLLLDTHTFLWHADGDLSVVGVDAAFDTYGITRLW